MCAPFKKGFSSFGTTFSLKIKVVVHYYENLMPKSSNNDAKMCIIKQNSPELHFCELIKLDSEFQDY